MNFFVDHCYGHGPVQALRTFEKAFRSGTSSLVLPTYAVRVIRQLHEFLTVALLLQLSAMALKTWCLFTGGACDPETCAGGVGSDPVR